MTEWKTYRLGDIASFSQGIQVDIDKQLPYKKGGYVRFIRIVDFTKANEPYRYIETPKKQYLTNSGDIVMIRYGSQTAGLVVKSFEGAIANNMFKITLDEQVVDRDFIYYALSQEDIFSSLRNAQSSSTMPAITFEIASRIQLKIPSLEEQRKIAGILGAIDDKIENNRRINTNLELQAQALYKQWFVDFEFPNEEGKPYKSSGGKMVDSELGLIPEGWSVGALSDLADITMGQSPNGKSFNENGEGIVFYQGRTEFGIRYPSIRLYTTEPTRYAEPMSVLLSVRAPVGDINIATQRCCIGRGVASIKSKTDDNAYMYCCLKELRPQLEQYNGEGTVFGSINRKELEGLVLCIPKYEIISKFNDVILGTDKQMLNLFQQTQNLATLRDTLLPKLMNGEIKL